MAVVDAGVGDEAGEGVGRDVFAGGAEEAGGGGFGLVGPIAVRMQ